MNTHQDLLEMLAATVKVYGKWNSASLAGYMIVLADVPLPTLSEVVMESMKCDHELPSAATLRSRCLARLGARVPSLEEAWFEVSKAFGAVGRYGKPDWSHDVIGETVLACGGWSALCGMAEDSASFKFRQAFKAAGERAERGLVAAPVADVVRELAPKLKAVN